MVVADVARPPLSHVAGGGCWAGGRRTRPPQQTMQLTRAFSTTGRRARLLAAAEEG